MLFRCSIRGPAPPAFIQQSKPLSPAVPFLALSSSSSSQTPKRSTTNPSSTSVSQTPIQTTMSSSSANQKPSQNTTSQQPRIVTSSVHGPSNLPPMSYSTGNSPYKPKQPRQHSKDIEATKLDALMNRMDRIEEAVGKYVDERGKAALKKSVVPGLDKKEGSNNKA